MQFGLQWGTYGSGWKGFSPFSRRKEANLKVAATVRVMAFMVILI